MLGPWNLGRGGSEPALGMVVVAVVAGVGAKAQRLGWTQLAATAA